MTMMDFIRSRCSPRTNRSSTPKKQLQNHTFAPRGSGPHSPSRSGHHSPSRRGHHSPSPRRSFESQNRSGQHGSSTSHQSQAPNRQDSAIYDFPMETASMNICFFNMLTFKLFVSESLFPSTVQIINLLEILVMPLYSLCNHLFLLFL